jgi:hypothetical protein
LEEVCWSPVFSLVFTGVVAGGLAPLGVRSAFSPLLKILINSASDRGFIEEVEGVA